MTQHRSPNRTGVGAYTVTSSQPFPRRYFADSDRRSKHKRTAAHLTIRLGSVPAFQAILDTLRLPDRYA